jgi:hypothetical protein
MSRVRAEPSENTTISSYHANVSDSNTSEIYLISRKNGEIAFSQTTIRENAI